MKTKEADPVSEQNASPDPPLPLYPYTLIFHRKSPYGKSNEMTRSSAKAAAERLAAELALEVGRSRLKRGRNPRTLGRSVRSRCNDEAQPQRCRAHARTNGVYFTVYCHASFTTLSTGLFQERGGDGGTIHCAEFSAR